MTVGILGGAFDPPHEGHLALARAGIDHFRLDRLLVRVVARPGHKTVATPAEDRLALARIAFAGVAGTEVALDPHARTVDSLEALGLRDPVFLLGSDELAAFPTWERPERVLELARLGVALRPGVDRARVDEVVAGLPSPERVELFPLPPIPVSSTEVRARLGRDAPLGWRVPPAVADEIERRGLYRGIAGLH